MGRMTQKEASGKWQVKGIPWEKLQTGEVITEEISKILYGCLCKLKDYEDTGMSPEHIKDMQYEAEDMAAQVCDKLCCHPREITEQEALDRICEGCPVEAYAKCVLDMDVEGERQHEKNNEVRESHGQRRPYDRGTDPDDKQGKGRRLHIGLYQKI